MRGARGALRSGPQVLHRRIRSSRRIWCARLRSRGRETRPQRLYAQYPASHWLDGGTRPALSRLLKDKGKKKAALEKAALASGAKVQLFSARSRERALAAWTRLSSKEKDLLGSLAHRVVQVEIPKRGVFYRLRAGPLADKAAAKRLCSQLKSRGRGLPRPRREMEQRGRPNRNGNQ